MNFDKLLPCGSKRRKIVKKILVSMGFFKKTSIDFEYRKWIEKNEPNNEQIKMQRNEKFKISPKISIIVPLYNTPEKFFDELVNSLKNQTYSNWELCLADGSPERPISFIKKYLKDTRIKYHYIGENKGISGNTNEALKLVTGDYIGLLDHDDLLPIFSLYEVVKEINENPDVEFIYSDEDKLEEKDGPRYGAFFKPDASPYTLNSANYICHFSVFKKSLMEKLQGFRSEYDGSQDFDIVARAFETTDKISHISKVLYHWRVHQNSTAGNSDSKPYAFEIGKKVIKDHVKRMYDTDVEVKDGLTPGSYELKYAVKCKPKVSIILDIKGLDRDNAINIENQLNQLTYKNFEIVKANGSKNYNTTIKNLDSEYFIIIDKDLLEIKNKDCIEQLLGICQDANVGLVGTKLYNENNLVEHAGIILGMNGIGDFLYKGVPQDAGTYMQRLIIIHNVSCVYCKYAMIRKDEFVKLHGFDEEFKQLAQNIDYCLKILNDNKQIVLNPTISFKVKQIEVNKITNKQEIFEKWDEYYRKGDKYFSPNLSKTNTGLSLKID